MHRIFFTLKLYYFLRNPLLFVHSIRNPICLLCEKIAIVDKDGNFTYEIPTDLQDYGYFLVTMEDPEFKIGCEKVTYFLWINEKSGLIMNAKDTHTIYTLSESSTKQVMN